ncbi:hypothetical protein ACV07N_01320 [Roseivirga echinicomitans]
MKKRDYIRILMAPLSMLTVFACSPNQFQTSQEYDDVYFTSADRVSKPTIIESTKEIESSNQRAFSLGDYSSESVDPMLVSKYTNSQDGEVVYFDAGPIVTKASDLNYDDFIYDYENENLAYYELPLDWDMDWDRNSFNSLMANDFQFQLAWYDQYYLNRDFRMNNYLAGNNRRRNSILTPRVSLNIGFASSVYSPFFFSGMTFVNMNRFGSFDPFWSPYDTYWSYGSYSPFYSAYGYGHPWGWNRWSRNPYSNYYYTSNYYYNNEGNLVNREGRNVTRGARINSTSVSSVRTDAINGSTPNTRSARYASNVGARSSRATSATNDYPVVGARSNSTALAGNTRSSRVNTNTYQFSNDSRLTRSNIVRGSSTRSSREQSSITSARSASSSGVTSARSRSSNSNLFSRSSSTRSATPSYSRSSSNSRSSGVSSGRSSSGSSRSGGVSTGRSSSNSSSSRSSGTVGSSSSRGGNSSSSSSSSSRSGNSSSSSSSSSSSRSGRGN